MLLLLAFACTDASQVSTEPAGDSGAADTSSRPAPTACGRELTVPMAGYVDEDPEPADAHAATFGAAPDPYQLHLGEFDDPSTSVSLVWRTDADTLATEVQYGTDTNFGATTQGASFLMAGIAEHGRVHEALLCDLAPGTTYHYRVGGEGHWSPTWTFTTAPAPGTSQRVRFAVAGDSRGDPATWAAILDAVEPHDPDFFMFTGDAVEFGVDVDEWGEWLDAGAGHFETRPLLPVHGNHEFQALHYYALFSLPENEQWYGFDWGPARLSVLNDTVAQAGDDVLQATWLQKQLAATTQPWRFTFHHIAIWSSSTTHGSDEDLQAIWAPVMEDGGVAVDFAGHNHNYERSYPLRQGTRVDATAGTTYVVTAGAGAPLYGNEQLEFTEVAVVTEHFVLADVDGGALTLTAYDLAGNVLDTFSTTR